MAKQRIDLSDFPLITISIVKIPFVLIYLILLFFGVDISFIRLVYSLSFCRNLIEMLPSKLQRKQLIDKAIFKEFYEALVKQISEHKFSVRKELLWVLIIIGDMVWIFALFTFS